MNNQNKSKNKFKQTLQARLKERIKCLNIQPMTKIRRLRMRELNTPIRGCNSETFTSFVLKLVKEATMKIGMRVFIIKSMILVTRSTLTHTTRFSSSRQMPHILNVICEVIHVYTVHTHSNSRYWKTEYCSIVFFKLFYCSLIS